MNGDSRAHLDEIGGRFDRIEKRLDGIDKRLADFGLRLPPLERDKEARDDEAQAEEA